MTKNNDNWSENPEYVKLVDFLVEKSKKVKTALNLRELVREFKKENNCTLKDRCWEKRIHRFRPLIHKFPRLDTETKVKLLFGLRAPVDLGFLKGLRKDAEVAVDDFNRIIHYKKNGGGLELIGKHKPGNYSQVSNDQFLEFLAEKVKETSGIISVLDLCEDFQAETGNSQSIEHLKQRFRSATEQIYESELFDEDMKIRMIFATSTIVNDYALEELRQNAIVVVDEQNRITEYQKSDGSLHLRGNPNRKRKRNDSSGEAIYMENFDELSEMISEEDAHSSDNHEIKLEPFDGGFLRNDEGHGVVINQRNDFFEEIPAGMIPAPIENRLNLKQEEMWTDVKIEESLNRDQTSLLTVLESFNALINTLDLPILAELQMKINQKMISLKNNHVIQMISNEEIRHSLEICLARVTKNAVIIEEGESISLKEFLGHLMFAVVLLKFPSPDSFQQKLKGIIVELRAQDKAIPMTILESALQTTFNVILAL